VVDSHPHLAKVRVAGSNPVFRSKYNRRSGTLLRVPDCFLGGVLSIILPITCHFRATLKSVEGKRRDAGAPNVRNGTAATPVSVAASRWFSQSTSWRRDHSQGLSEWPTGVRTSRRGVQLTQRRGLLLRVGK
jgi:hypothetical protein